MRGYQYGRNTDDSGERKKNGQNRVRVGRSGQGKQGAFPFLCANLWKIPGISADFRQECEFED